MTDDQQKQADPVAEAYAHAQHEFFEAVRGRRRFMEIPVLWREISAAVEARAIAQWGAACAECGHGASDHVQHYIDTPDVIDCMKCMNTHVYESRDDRLRRAADIQAQLAAALNAWEVEERRAEAAEARAQVYREALVDALEGLESWQAQWGDDYLAEKWLMAEYTDRARAALAPVVESRDA